MYQERRQAIRDTWLPALAAMPSAEHAFVVGTPKDADILRNIRQEEIENESRFMVLDSEVRFCGPLYTDSGCVLLLTL